MNHEAYTVHGIDGIIVVSGNVFRVKRWIHGMLLCFEWTVFMEAGRRN